MKNNNILLSQIMVADIEGRATSLKISQTDFDLRNDIVVSPKTYSLAVSLSFFNENWQSAEIGSLIRRKFTAILTDDATGEFVSSKAVILRAPACEMTTTELLHIPFKAAELPLDRDYRLIVTDATTGAALGSRQFHILPDIYDGRKIEDAFSAEEAGVMPVDCNSFFSSYPFNAGDYARVRFNLCYEFNDWPEKFPEVEIRIFFPDGSFSQSFRSVICDDPDADRFHVDAPFHLTANNRGIVYAEALVNDIAFAGVVFSTEDEEKQGALTGRNLHILESVSNEAVDARFSDQSETAAEIEADDFDKLLDAFISGESRQSEPESVTADFDRLVGLTDVKSKLAAYEKLMRFNSLREKAGLAVTSAPLHAMFLGSPGTGKTTVAKMMSKMLHNLGLLSKGHIVVRERATLSGTHYGDHEDLTLKALEEARGGILFIDEAYQLFQHSDPKDPGRLVIETLLTALADETNRDWMLILAGYTDEMLRMFEINPGLRSRIPESNIYTFADLSEAELLEVAARWFDRNDYILTPDARMTLTARLNADYAARNKSFGNARHVMNIIQTGILPSMASRIMDSAAPANQSLTEIHDCDIPLGAAIAPTPRPRVGYLP